MDYITSNSEWQFVGIYAGKATGTNFSGRDEFNRIITDAKAGKINLILIKSISRFGRNILPFLQSIHVLNQKGVVVYFEA